MMRASGILLGILLMLAVFLLALSVEVLPPPSQMLVNSDGSEADKSSLVIQPEPAGDVPVEVVVNSVASVASASLEESRLIARDDGLEVNPQPAVQSMRGNETAYGEGAEKVSRYPVWSPFRSKWAAQGFARRLTLATGVPVEVINQEPTSYQVVFSYRDDQERQAMVTQIETVTGLELE